MVDIVASVTVRSVQVQGLSLLKALGELEDWSAIYAVARSEIPLSSKIHQLALDLDDKEVHRVLPPSFVLLPCHAAPVVQCFLALRWCRGR